MMWKPSGSLRGWVCSVPLGAHALWRGVLACTPLDVSALAEPYGPRKRSLKYGIEYVFGQWREIAEQFVLAVVHCLDSGKVTPSCWSFCACSLLLLWR